MAPLSQQQQAPAPHSPLLLFAHGGGLCKEAWEPIIRRLHESPLQKRTPFATYGIDFRYHGSKRDDSIKPRVFSVGPKAQRSIHPINAWVATATQEIVDYVREFKKQHPQTPLIGIGHSMGAVALWLTEISHPGSFDGLILFEPMYGLYAPETSHLQDMLVGATLRREAHWPSREAALRHFAGFKNFASWDKESLAAYLKGALIEEQDGSIALACHPRIEAGIYCGYACWISVEESARPKCRVSFQGGERSPFFAVDHFEEMRAQSPHIYKISTAMPKCSHAMVMENPELASQKILEDLAELPVFAQQHHVANSSSRFDVSRFFAVDHFEEIRAQSPHIYKISTAMPKCSHAMVMENPELASQKILEDLAELPVDPLSSSAAPTTAQNRARDFYYEMSSDTTNTRSSGRALSYVDCLAEVDVYLSHVPVSDDEPALLFAWNRENLELFVHAVNDKRRQRRRHKVPDWFAQNVGTITLQSLIGDVMSHLAQASGGRSRSVCLAPNSKAQLADILVRLADFEAEPFVQWCLRDVPAGQVVVAIATLRDRQAAAASARSIPRRPQSHRLLFA